MRKIFNQLGYISRPVVIGAALSIATVAVGIGIVTQFTGGDKGAKGFSGAALEQYSAGASASSATYSKEALEASMAAAEAARNQGDSVYSLKGAAAKDNFSVGRGANQGSGAGSGMGPGGVAAMGTAGLQGSSFEAMGGAGGISAIAEGYVPNASGEAAQEAAAAAAAAGAGLNASQTAKAAAGKKAQLSTSKMTTGGGKFGGPNAGSASTSVRASAGNYSAETSGAKIPQGAAAALKGAETDAFKSGRVGSMGGSNVAGGRGGEAGSGQQAATALAGLNTATRYSKMGSDTVYGDGTKGAVLAAQAFDGGVANEGISIDPNAGVAAQANAQMERMSSTIGGPKFGKRSLVDPVMADQERAQDLRKKIKGKMWGMVAVGVAGAIAVQVLANAASAGGPFTAWLWAAAAVAGAAAIGGMIALFANILSMIKELDGLQYGGGSGARKGIAITLFALFTAAVGVSFIPGAWAKVWSALGKAKAWLVKMLGFGA